MTAPHTRGAVPFAAIDDLSVDELGRAIAKHERGMNAESYRALLLVRAFDERYGWAKWGCASCAEWLVWSCGLSLSAARERVRTANALRVLPAISAALADGRLSYTKARALTRVAAEHDEDLLLAYALNASAPQVEERCRQIRNVAPASVEGARQVWERRSLKLFRDSTHNRVRIVIELPAAEGELISHAIDSAVAAGEAALGVEFATARDGGSAANAGRSLRPTERSGEGWRAQQADAVVAIMKDYLGGGSATRERSVPAADHYQVLVHVDEKALRGGAGRSDLPIETVRRLACDCSLVTIVDDGHGTPLDVGRKHRTISTALRRALQARDRGCVFPGCSRAHYVDGHHIRHWIDGGETSLENTTLLCTHHHTLLHEGGFTIHRDERGGMYFRRPDGRVMPRGGYRAEDMVDDGIGAEGADLDRAAAEARMAAIVSGRAYHDYDGVDPSAEGWMHGSGARDPSVEVREPAGVYRLAQSSRSLVWQDRARTHRSP
ncbi:MAG TPA: DUF222 domain-containing protein, partial [Gammaproteobacteria bacterium]|nr:DUF222 domain-containing protein [Gammaproteobacteria bacterium]